MPSKKQQKATLIATILASSMAFIDASALNIALPAIQDDLNLAASDLLWIINGYTLFLSALLLTGGSLGDIYGQRKIFAIGIAVFTGASAGCGMADSQLMLIGFRCLQGVGGAMMVPGSLSILSSVFPREKRGRAIGTWSMFSSITTVLGPALGGWLAEIGYWRAIFFINVPLAIVALFYLSKVPGHTTPQKGDTDVSGAVLATLALIGITYGFIEAPRLGFDHYFIYGSLALGIIFFLLFILHEYRSTNALLPLHLFRYGLFSVTNIITFFIYAGLSGFLFFFPLNLVQVQGYRAGLAGLALLPFGLVIAFMSRWAGYWADKAGPRAPLIVGPMLTALGFFLFAMQGLTTSVSDFWTTFFPALMVLSFGMGITVAPLTTAVMNSVPNDRTGIASGVNNTIARTAGVVAIAVLGSLGMITFEKSLTKRTAALELSSEAMRELEKEVPKLAEAEPPEGVDTVRQQQLETAIKFAFIDVFKQSVLIASILSGVSVLISYLFIRKVKK